MKIKLKPGINAWANGEVVYIAGDSIDADKRFAAEMIATGAFEEERPEAPAGKKESTKKEEIK